MSVNGEHSRTWRTRYLVPRTNLLLSHRCQIMFCLRQQTAIYGPNSAILLTHTFNRILFYVCNGRCFDVQKARTGIGEQSRLLFFSFLFISSHLKPMDLIITILPVVTKDLPISPRFTPYNFLSRCKFSTLTTRQQMVEFYCSLKVAVNTIVPRSPFFAFCTLKYRLL